MLAAGLGSDVPFALLGATALGEGHGEEVTPVADLGSWWWVVVPSTEGMSTPAVYRHYDEVRPDAPVVPGPPDEILAALASGDPRQLATALHNDLEQAAFDLRPDLAALLVEGVDAGAWWHRCRLPEADLQPAAALQRVAAISPSASAASPSTMHCTS